MRSVQSPLKIFDTFCSCAMQFVCEATHVAFPQPVPQRAACFSDMFLELSVV
jgi:hypothetical protein